MFGWLAIVIGVFSGLIPQVQFWRFNMRRYDIDLIDVLLAHPLLLSMAAAAAGSFRRERESGVLELLLVSPLDASTIVFGRIRGLFAQFLPSVVLILVGWIFLVTLWPDSATDQLWPVVRFAALSLAIPCLGLYASLRTRNFISAFLLAVVLGWGVPWLTSVVWGLVCFGLDLGIRRGMVPMSISLLPAMAALVLGGTAVQLMIRRLEQRRFEFNREVT
jgi:ABC-type Na+ efflux pump permease subunit